VILVFIQVKKTWKVNKIILLSGLMILLVFPIYLFQAEAQLPGTMRTTLHDDVVILHTKQGQMIIELYPDEAPKHVQNFLSLVQSGFYDRTIFHRIIPGFMIQGGDPTTKPGGASPYEWGRGDPGYSIDAEFNQLMHNRGMVSMARSADPDSAGSQFFIVHQNSNFLDGEYTVFGRLITQSSYDTLDAIASLTTTQLGSPGGGVVVNDIPLDYGSAELVFAKTQKHAEIQDKLELGIPERISFEPKSIPSAKSYVNSEFGFSIDVPRGFVSSEPLGEDETIPVVTLLGEKVGNYTPTAYVQVMTPPPNAETFLDVVQNRLDQIQLKVDDGSMRVIGHGLTTINDMEGYSISVETLHNTNSGSEFITFKQFLFPTSNNVYALVFSDSSSNFQNAVSDFEIILNSFKINELSATNQAEATSIKETMGETSSNEEGGGCLIATAAFGSEMAPQVQFLRELRDNTVLQTQSGTSFMTGFNQFYYSFSPAVADLERENPAFKETVKLTLTPLLASLTLLNYVDIDTEQEILGYGIGIIMLNIGMYFVAPAILIISAKRFLTKQKQFSF